MHRDQQHWFCLRQRDCSLNCTQTATQADTTSITCITGFSDDGTPLTALLPDIKIMKGVCNNISGASGEGLEDFAIIYFKCLTACYVTPGGDLPPGP